MLLYSHNYKLLTFLFLFVTLDVRSGMGLWGNGSVTLQTDSGRRGGGALLAKAHGLQCLRGSVNVVIGTAQRV